MNVVKLVRAHVGIAALTAAAILGGAGAATAVVATSADTPMDTSAVTDQATTSSATPTSEEPAVSPAPVQGAATPTPTVVEEPAVQAQTATVQAVTTDQAQPSEPVVDDPALSGIGTTGEDGQYTPAPGPVVGGLPAPIMPQIGPPDLLPGEPGYQPPQG